MVGEQLICFSLEGWEVYHVVLFQQIVVTPHKLAERRDAGIVRVACKFLGRHHLFRQDVEIARKRLRLPPRAAA